MDKDEFAKWYFSGMKNNRNEHQLSYKTLIDQLSANLEKHSKNEFSDKIDTDLEICLNSFESKDQKCSIETKICAQDMSDLDEDVLVEVVLALSGDQNQHI